MPPALALCVLAMLLHAQTINYALGVVEATVVIAGAFLLYRAFVFAPLLHSEPSGGEASSESAAARRPSPAMSHHG